MCCGIFVGTSHPQVKVIWLFTSKQGLSKKVRRLDCVWTIACNPYIQVNLKKREPLVYLSYFHVCQTVEAQATLPRSPCLRCYHNISRGLLETRPVHYVYPTWSAQPHRGVGHAPVVLTISGITLLFNK